MAINDQVRTDRGTVWDASERRDESLTDIEATSLQGVQVGSASPTEGDLLLHDGSKWAPSGVLDMRGADKIPFQFDPQDIDADAPLWRFALATANSTTLARDNVVGIWGWNIKDAGGQDDPTEASLSINFESHFEDPNDNIPQLEWHVQAFDVNGTQIRPFTCAVDRDLTAGGVLPRGPVDARITAHRINISVYEDNVGNDRNVLWTDAQGTDERRVVITGSAGVRANFTTLEHESNNVEWIKQPDSSGTPQTLIFLDGADAVRVDKAGGGTRFGGSVGINGAGTAAALEVTADSDGDLFVWRNNAETEQLDARWAGGSNNILQLGGGTKPRIDIGPNGWTASPEISMQDGKVGILTNSIAGAVAVGLATEDLDIVDAGSTGATEQDWVEVQVGGVTGYLRVHAAK